MRIILPLPLRRSLLTGLSVCSLLAASVTLCASGREYVVDATQASDSGRNMYRTLAELAASGSLAAGDTVILHNDDSTLVSGLSVPVNFRSNDPEAPRTVDLSGLGNAPMFNLAPGDYSSNMESVVWANAPDRIFFSHERLSSSRSVSLKISGNTAFTGNSSFFNNQSSDTGYGGAVSLFMEGSARLTLGNNIVFADNYTYPRGSHSGGAVSVHSYLGEAVLAMGDHIVFTGNYATKDGGAVHIYGDKGSSVTMGDGAVFTGNYVSDGYSADGGAISIVMPDSTNYGENSLTLGANARFTGNYLSGRYCRGGAIALNSSSRSEISTLNLGSGATFTGNYAFSSAGPDYAGTGYGGAIYVSASRFSNVAIQDGAAFLGNYASTQGGAIYLVSGKAGSSSRFLALTRDVLFSGNMTGGTFTQLPAGGFSVENGVANAIHVKGEQHFQLAAAQGREVRLNDPLTGSSGISGYPDYTEVENITLSINRYADDGDTVHPTGGTVVFSGKLYQGDDSHLVASRYSDFKGQTTLYGGTLVLEHDVVFGNSELREDTSMTLEKGILEITGGSTVNAASFTVANSGVVLRPGTSAFINAHDVDLSRGFVFDMQKQLQGKPSGGISISARDTFTLGGSIAILDSGVSADYFYADNSWAQERTFIVLTDADKTHTNDFSGAYSMATGSEFVDSPYAYTGSWSCQWLDRDGDGFAEQLQLVWTPTPGEEPIRDILPELAGALAVNSMWSSASNVLGLSGAALGNLDARRFTTGPESNYWVKGLGDFLSHGSEGVRDGFDYNGGGYAVGADRRVAGNAILGVGLGDLYGRMYGRSFVGDIGQQTRIAMLYGGWQSNLGRKDTLLVTGSAGYGWTDNTMNSFHTGGWSRGTWTNRALAATLDGKWSRELNENLAVDFMLGLEYTDVTQDSFTETGWDARRFGKGSLKNLSLPVGVGLSCRSELKGREWINRLAVSYVPDVCRENAGAPAERLLNGYRWEAEGTAPDRNAVRVNVASALQLNARWRAYAGYEFEGRSKAVAHRFNAGVSFAY